MFAACGGGTPGDSDGGGDSDARADDTCIDSDGDGAGVGDGCDSDDCDDTDPDIISECGDDCETNPERAGCPCELGLVVSCYEGPEGTAGQGVCAEGLKGCGQDGTWGGCDGQTLPAIDVETVCNDLDDNCDGEVDEGIQNPCGDCNQACEVLCVGVGCDEPFHEDEGRSIVHNADGSITLSEVAQISNYVLWVANSMEGTISKVNTRTRLEEGRYITMPPEIAQGENAFPATTTVNGHGDVVVSNQHENVGGSTKILASDCPDQNRNGRIETSSGGLDLLEWGDDECVVWYVTDVPAARGNAFEVRLELDFGIHEYVWVASYTLGNLRGGTIYEIDSVDGEMTGRSIGDTPGFNLAMGPGGLLWSVELDGCPRATDTTTLEQVRYEGCAGTWGLVVDSEGRPWTGGDASRLDIESGVWEQPVDANGFPFPIHGSGITVDAFGNAYTGRLDEDFQPAFKIDGETMAFTLLPDMGGHNWAVDFDGFIWAVEERRCCANVMDPATFEVETINPPFIGPFPQGDMTGFQLQNTVAPAGVYERVFQTCNADEPLHLYSLEWDAIAPPGSSVIFRLKHAGTLEALEEMAWIDIGSTTNARSPIDLDEVLTAAGVDTEHLGHFVMIEATLQSIDRQNRPTLNSFAVSYSCSIAIH